MASIVEKSGKLFRKYVCSECGKEVDNDNLEQCPYCNAAFEEIKKQHKAEIQQELEKKKRKKLTSAQMILLLMPAIAILTFIRLMDAKDVYDIGATLLSSATGIVAVVLVGFLWEKYLEKKIFKKKK